jgi:hypothetical protein
LSIRILVVNGFLNLQIGRFDKQYSPQILASRGLAVYETFATITSFPLMYFGDSCGLPIRYLNFVAAATPSYKESHDERVNEKKRWKNRYTDWRALQGDVAVYRALCERGSPAYNRLNVKQLQEFRGKCARLLEADGYTTHKHNDDDGWRFPDYGSTYWNSYGQLFFRNMNANRNSGKDKQWFTDYYEEMP